MFANMNTFLLNFRSFFFWGVVVWYRDVVMTPWFTSLSHSWSNSFSTRYHQCNIARSATGLVGPLGFCAETLLLNTVHVHPSAYWVTCAILFNGFGRHPNLWTITKDGNSFNRDYLKNNWRNPQILFKFMAPLLLVYSIIVFVVSFAS